MKHSILHITTAAILGLALIGSQTLFAQDQNQNKQNSKDFGAAPQAAKEKPRAADQVEKKPQREDLSATDKAGSKTKDDKTAGGDSSIDMTRKDVTGAKQSDWQSQSKQKQSTTVAVQGTRANNYNGQWVTSSAHSDWDVNANHNWNNHEYRYYNGGWLIIDSSSFGDIETGAMVIRVKQSLAQRGYYTGRFTETVGPHTRQAISNYESAEGLQVNGRIDGPLLTSLGLE